MFSFVFVVYSDEYTLASPYGVHPGRIGVLESSMFGFGMYLYFLFLCNNFVTPHIAQHWKSLKNVDITLVHLSTTLFRKPKPNRKVGIFDTTFFALVHKRL